MAEQLPPLVADLQRAMQALHENGWMISTSGLALFVENGRERYWIHEPSVYTERDGDGA